MEVRDSLKVLMAVLALVGITGMYLRQVTETGLLGLIGYVVLGIGYHAIMCTTYIAAFVLPTIAETERSFVTGVIEATNGDPVTGDIGLLEITTKVQDFSYLAGGLLFGIALYRARVLARWASALLAFPNGIAMIALGYSLWSLERRGPAAGAIPAARAESGQVPQSADRS